LVGKKWLENREKEPPQPPVEIATSNTVNFPKQLPENLEPAIIRDKPVITAEKPVQQDNLPPPIKIKPKPGITNYQPKPLISEIPPKPQEKISPNIITETKSLNSEQLPVITNQPTGKEQFLLVKIKQLEEQLKQTQTENKNLTTKLAQSEALSQSEKQRANYYQQQLKSIAKTLYQ